MTETCPDKMLLLHGLLDGELDAVNSVAIETHLKTCAGCADELSRLQSLRQALADRQLRARAPAALRQRIEESLTSATATAAPMRRTRLKARAAAPWFLSGGFAALAAGVAIVAILPRDDDAGLPQQLVAGHVRSLLAQHLTDVATSNRHVVKPWFNGRIDFAPPVVDLADQGFPLVGGRLDYIENRVVPALVYHRRQHTINLFIWPAADHPAPHAAAKRDGYSLACWTSQGLVFCAVSDIDAAELHAFETTFIQQTGS